MTAYANVPHHRSQWMELCVRDSGEVDWNAFQMMQPGPVTLADFLDMREVSTVTKDRTAVWEKVLEENPSLRGKT